MTDITFQPEPAEPVQSAESEVVDFAKLHEASEKCAIRARRLAVILGGGTVFCGLSEINMALDHSSPKKMLLELLVTSSAIGQSIYHGISAARENSRAAQFEVAAMQAGQIEAPTVVAPENQAAIQ